MVSDKSVSLRVMQTVLYFIIFCFAVTILGIYSHFLAYLRGHAIYVGLRWRAVTGISSAAVLYLSFAMILTSCFGGIPILAFLAIVIDIAFCGAMIAVAVITRRGARSCSGYVWTPLGYGPANTGAIDGDASSSTLHAACKQNTAVFAVSITASILSLVTAAMQVPLIHYRKEEEYYGPGSSDDYTSGSGEKRWSMFHRKTKTENHDRGMEDAMNVTAVDGNDTAATAAAHHDKRPSYDTTMTGSTAAAPGASSLYDKAVQ